MGLRRCLFLLAMVLAVPGCQWTEPEADHVAFGIRDDIILQLRQDLSPEGSTLSFVFQSSGEFNCDNAGFDYQTSIAEDRVDIQLMQLDIPEPCTGESAPATEEIDMPSGYGTYEVSIQTGAIIRNTGVLTIDYKGYRLVMEAENGLSIPHKTMLRIPRGLIWGYVYNPVQQTYASQKFTNDLSPLTTPASLETGHYGPFNAIGADQISMSLPEARATATPFAFRMETQPGELSQTLQDIRAALPAGTEVRVFDWRGLEY